MSYCKLNSTAPIVLILLVIISTREIQGANIVFFFGIATYSHRITVWPLVESLAERGHNVTFISAYPPKKPNPKVRELTPKPLMDWVASWEEGPQAFSDRRTGKFTSNWFFLPVFGQTLCELFLSDINVIDWIENTPVDLVIIDSLFNDCGYAIAQKNKAKHIIFGTTSILAWHYEVFGLVVESSWIPDMIYYFPQNMTFMEKLITTLHPVYWHFIREWKVMPELEALMKQKLGLDVKLRDVEKETSLILLNTHFSEEYARSLPPMVIPVGGMHCRDKTEPLPKDMEEFVSKPGSRGFIYISFGSCVEISNSPPEIKNAFFKALLKFKDIQFIWKWEGDFPKEPLPNVKFVKWAPQQDILAHPKLKAFMTHSGLLSIQEAIYRGIPMISMPVFAEQDYNAERIHRMEHGIRLEVTDITEEQLTSAIRNILEDPKYSNNMKLLSKRFKDRPMKPADTALWWTEYVLRHDDTSHLAPLSRYQTWYQKRLLDVWAFVATILLLFVAIVSCILIKIVKLVCKSINSATSISKGGKGKVKKN